MTSAASCERYKIPVRRHHQLQGRRDGGRGQVVGTWDPHTHPVVTEVAGLVKFQDFVDGMTVTSQVDEVIRPVEHGGARYQAARAARKCVRPSSC